LRYVVSTAGDGACSRESNSRMDTLPFGARHYYVSTAAADPTVTNRAIGGAIRIPR
jgi:hypothetical protein